MDYLILDIESFAATWAPVVVQIFVAAGVIFGGAEYWKYKQTKLQVKLDKESKESGVEKKMEILTDSVDNLKDTVSVLDDKVSSLDDKVGDLADEIKDVKNDMILLQKANKETVKYRELRDQQDQKAVRVQEAIIQSLMGILRERLVESYHRCQEKGYYSEEEREVYGKMYECYTQDPFNGNGVIHQLQPIMQNMPWTEEDAKKKNKKTIG